jgi:hypothetical protein
MENVKNFGGAPIGFQPSKSKKAYIEIERKSINNLKSVFNAEHIINKGIRKAWFVVGSENIKHTRRLFALPKRGEWYTKPDGKTVHRASAPGEPPANWSFKLSNTMKYVVRSHTQMEFGAQMFYGKYLEEGKKTDRNFKRPFLAVTVREREKDNELIMNGYVNNEIRKNTS